MDAAPDPPRCPFSDAGTGDDDMRECPGFVAVSVRFPADTGYMSVGSGVAAADSCARLVAAPSSRGWFPACTHKGGLPRLADGTRVRRPERSGSRR